MSERVARPAFLAALLLLAAPVLAAPVVAAEPAVALLDLPFAASALRGPGSEVAVAVATSGLLPLARPKAGASDDGAPLAVVWGEAGGAALALVDGRVTVTLLGREAVEGLAAAETPRGALAGALAGSRRAVVGGLSAHLAEPVTVGGRTGAGALVIRERKAVPMSAEPKPVPVAIATVRPAPAAAFALRSPHIAAFDGRPAILAVTAAESGSSLVVVEAAEAGWTVRARSPLEVGKPLQVAGVADFSGTGRPQIAVTGPADGGTRLRLWAYEGGALRALSASSGHDAAAPGYDAAALGYDAAALGYDAAALGEGGPGLSALLPRDGAVDLALPVADRSALAIVSLKGAVTERARVALPAPAAFGVATLGTGPAARLLVGLADGRIAVVNPHP